MKILALDYGDVRTGIAISDAIRLTAQNPSFVQGGASPESLDSILRIAEENEVAEILVGLPKRMDGSLGPQAEKVMEFADRLKERFSGKVVLWDERLSTAAATRTLIQAGVRRKKRKTVRDGVAAMILLQSYLDRLQGEPP